MIFLKITDIQKQRGNKNRYSVYIEGEFAFGLDEVDMLYYKLFNASEISEEKYNHIKENVIFNKARDAAVRFLGFKARTKKEVENKLKEKDFPEDIIFKVIELMQKYGYIDDYSYAGSFLRDKFNLKGFGTNRIKYELKMKGVSDDIIQQVIEENDIDEAGRAACLVRKKYMKLDNLDFKEKRKIHSFLTRKGFSFSVIESAFNILEDEGF